MVERLAVEREALASLCRRLPFPAGFESTDKLMHPFPRCNGSAGVSPAYFLL